MFNLKKSQLISDISELEEMITNNDARRIYEALKHGWFDPEHDDNLFIRAIGKLLELGERKFLNDLMEANIIEFNDILAASLKFDPIKQKDKTDETMPDGDFAFAAKKVMKLITAQIALDTQQEDLMRSFESLYKKKINRNKEPELFKKNLQDIINSLNDKKDRMAASYMLGYLVNHGIIDATEVIDKILPDADENEAPAVKKDSFNLMRIILSKKKKPVKYNPWAVCQTSVGKENKDKFERCVHHIKDKNKKAKTKSFKKTARRDYLTLGPVPAEEECEQVGPNFNSDKAVEESKRYIDAIRNKLGPEPPGAHLAVKWFPHDFGMYNEVVCYFDDENEEATNYAYKCESEAPTTWDNSQEMID